jgi:hypothetical protein
MTIERKGNDSQSFPIGLHAKVGTKNVGATDFFLAVRTSGKGRLDRKVRMSQESSQMKEVLWDWFRTWELDLLSI